VLKDAHGLLYLRREIVRVAHVSYDGIAHHLKERKLAHAFFARDSIQLAVSLWAEFRSHTWLYFWFLIHL
jgi:hypothetical protein